MGKKPMMSLVPGKMSSCAAKPIMTICNDVPYFRNILFKAP
jgi:hypothetical protein